MITLKNIRADIAICGNKKQKGKTFRFAFSSEI